MRLARELYENNQKKTCFAPLFPYSKGVMNNTTSPQLYTLSIGDNDFRRPMTLEIVEERINQYWPFIWGKKEGRELQMDDFQELQEYWNEKTQCWEILDPEDGVSVWAFFSKV